MGLEPGLVHEEHFTVQDSDTTAVAASAHGMDLPKVLSTPRMISFMETTSYWTVAGHLESGQTTVGSTVNIRHLAATPPGMRVRVRAELVEVDGRRLKFKVEAWDEVEKIGEGEHGRFIIDRDRFTRRLEEKKSSQAG